MHLADCYFLPNMPATDQQVLSLNHQTYQRLKIALSLNLRRQIFVAVCDDLDLRNRLAAQIHKEMAYPAHSTQRAKSARYPRLASLLLNLSDPNPIEQMNQWLIQHPSPKSKGGRVMIPTFQILGVERLTRESAAVQRLFLSYLQGIEHSLPTLDSSFLLWLSRPWFHAIQESAPEFWSWRTGVFEFVGEPQPVPDHPPKLAADPPKQEVSTTNGIHAQPSEATSNTESDSVTVTGPTQQRIWDILTHDLANLGANRSEANAAPDTKADSSAQEDPSLSALPKQTSELPQTNATTSTVFVFPITAGSASSAGTADGTEATQLNPDRQTSSVAATSTEGARLLVPPPFPNASRSSQPNPVREESQSAQILQYIEELHLQQSPPTTLAAAYRTLGNFYREQYTNPQAPPATQGAAKSAEVTQRNLLMAVQAYEQALEWLENATVTDPTSSAAIASSTFEADLLNDLGNLYWMLSRRPPEPNQVLSYLDKSIQTYQIALTKIISAAQPHSYAMIQNNLGAAYGDLSRYRDPAENLQYSIAAYAEALQYRQATTEPLKYASTQNNLGTAYWNLAQYQQPVNHLVQAIASYTEALRYYHPEQEPMNYAMIQNNLGTAYWNLAQYKTSFSLSEDSLETAASPEDFLRLAVGAYRIALIYRTPETSPLGHAATQNNLGTAYWHLANQPETPEEAKITYLQQAIAAYTSALKVAQQQLTENPLTALTFDRFATYNNLGLAHHQLATGSSAASDKTIQMTHLEAALDHHLQALQGWQQKPEFYQTALGYVTKTIRSFYSEGGLQGQNLALSKIPGQLLPEIMTRL